MDADVIVVLRRLAESCQDAAGSAAELAERYGALRAEAMELNEQHGWATADDLAAQLPSLEALGAIESLDRAFGETSAPDRPVERGNRGTPDGGADPTRSLGDRRAPCLRDAAGDGPSV